MIVITSHYDWMSGDYKRVEQTRPHSRNRVVKIARWYLLFRPFYRRPSRLRNAQIPDSTWVVSVVPWSLGYAGQIDLKPHLCDSYRNVLYCNAPLPRGLGL